MWKPGDAKPKGKEDDDSPPSKKGPTKKLSGATMNMKFMQRRRTAAAAAPERQPQAAVTDQQEAPPTRLTQKDDVHVTVATTSYDIYGPDLTALGRRSFGGMNPVMEDVWKIAQGEERRRKEEKTDEELLQQYDDFVKNGRKRAMEDGSAPRKGGKRKAKRQGVSMGRR